MVITDARGDPQKNMPSKRGQPIAKKLVQENGFISPARSMANTAKPAPIRHIDRMMKDDFEKAQSC